MATYKVKTFTAYWGGKVDSYGDIIENENYPAEYDDVKNTITITRPDGKKRVLNLNLFPDYILEIENETTVSKSKGQISTKKGSKKGTRKVSTTNGKGRS